jgi:predicted RNase H-like HicB family nuclease
MLNFLNGKKIQKEIALPFEVILEFQEDGYFLATCPALPGCTAQGQTKSEALQNISQAVRNFMARTGQGRFELVLQNPEHPTLHALAGVDGKLVAGSNRDGALATAAGALGTWSARSITGGTEGTKGSRTARHGHGREESEAPDLVDFSTQIYCLQSHTSGGATRLYAGTSASGTIYESLDGTHWDPSFATGEARVHALASFQNRLYAGTSVTGKLFCLSGGHWSLVHRSGQSAITALAEFHGEFYMGTYPTGQIFLSGDGAQWHLAFDSGQTFVRALQVFQGRLYAATSKATGGVLYRTADGVHWEKVFESRDPNFYCLADFHHALWLGTGSSGRLYRSQDGTQWTLEQAFEEEGIRALYPWGGRLYLCTDTRGSVYRSTFASTSPPQINSLKVEAVTSQSALVTWSTDRPSDSLVRFGLTPALDSSVHLGTPATEHKVPLASLKELTTYHYQVLSRSAEGSEAAFTDTGSFTTASAESTAVSSPTHPDPEIWYRHSAAVLCWNSRADLVRYHYCLDQVPTTEPEPGQTGVQSTGDRSVTFEHLASGVWWFHLRTEDRHGHLGLQASHFRLRIDREVGAPLHLHSPSHPAEGEWTNRSRVRWHWEAPEDLSGVAGYYVVLDRQPGTLPQAGNATLVRLPQYEADLEADGEWHFHVTCLDQAGNAGNEAAHWHLKLDTRADPPEVSSLTHPDASRWANSTLIQLEWTQPADASGVAGYYTAFDQDPETLPAEGSATYTPACRATVTARQDGLWYFHVATLDMAGNSGRHAAHFAVRVDTQALPPSIQSSSHPQGAWMSQKQAVFDLTAPEDLSGIAGFYVSLDRESHGLPTPENARFTRETHLEFPGLEDGIWYLHAVSQDLAGNIGSLAAHYAVRIDTQALPPRVSSPSHPHADAWRSQSMVELVWDAPEDLSGAECYFWCLDQDPATIPTALTGQRTSENHLSLGPQADGVWYFHIVSQDKAGNLGLEAAHIRLQIDTQALPPRLSSPSHRDREGWSSQARVQFEWADPEDYSGVAGYYHCLDRQPDTVPGPSNGIHTTERRLVLDRGLDGDGRWFFHLTTQDKAGNLGSQAAHYPVNLDTRALPPALASPTHPNAYAWSGNPSPVFTWTAPEDHSGIAGYYYVLDQNQGTLPNEAIGTWTEETRASFAGLADGVWHLHVVSKDRCGNVSAEASHLSVRIDTQALPPAVSCSTHPSGQWTANPNPTFVWTAPPDLSGIVGYYTLLDREAATIPTKSSGQFTTATSASFQKLEDGLWIFHVVSVDQAGNTGALAAHHSVQVDATARPPKVSSVTHPDPAAWSAKASAQIAWEEPKDPSGVKGYYYSVDQSASTVPDSRATWTTERHVTLPPYPDGEWTFHIVSKDATGNVSQEASHFNFRIDTSAPTPRLLSRSHPAPETWSNVNRPAFVWEDGPDLSGVAAHYWTFDHQADSPILLTSATQARGDAVVLPPQKDGLWYFHVAARDQAGNVSEPAHWPVRIETVPPVSFIDSLPACTHQATFEVRWKGEDAVSGLVDFDLQVKEGEGEWRPWLSHTPQTGSPFTGLDGVRYQFRVRATDKAGNVEPWSENAPVASILVDLTPPEPVKKLEVRAGAAGSMNLSWEASQDAASGLAWYRVYRSAASGVLGTPLHSGPGVKECAFADPGQGLEDGRPYFYTIRPVDLAGNEQTTGNVQVSGLCDRIALPPQPTSPTHAPGQWSSHSQAVLVWETPPDSSGIQEYFYVVDQQADTLPTAGSGTRVSGNQVEVGPLGDGAWHFHIISRDLAGNLSQEAGHATLHVDLTPPPAPEVRCLTHPPNAWSAETEARFEWQTPQDTAGIAGYHYVLDGKIGTVPGPGQGAFTPENHLKLTDLEEGTWYLHVAARDGAGNLGQTAGHVRLQVARTPPPPDLRSATHPDPSKAGLSEAHFTWATPAWPQTVAAWHYVLDDKPETLPDANAPRTAQNGAAFKDLPDGNWWMHIISVDSLGHLGRTAGHYPFKVASRGSLLIQLAQANGMMPAAEAGLELMKDPSTGLGQAQSVALGKTDPQGRYKFEALEPGIYGLQVDVQGLPPQIFEGIEVRSEDAVLSLSSELCAWPNPAPAGSPIRFSLLAKEAGTLTLKVYTDTGKAAHNREVAVEGRKYLDLEWEPGPFGAGGYMYQVILKTEAGTLLKTPIRKLKIN